MRVDVEHPQNANLPKRVSYSQMSLYQQCGLKFFFSYIHNWQEPPTSALVGGNITHLVAEELYKLAPNERTLDNAMEILRLEGPKFLARPENREFDTDFIMKQNVREAVENLFTIESPPEIVVLPEHLEMKLRVEINGVEFTGTVDRFTQDGIKRVSDYKTGKSPGRFLDGKLIQTYLYALAFKTQFEIDVDEVELIFLNSKESFRRPAEVELLEDAGTQLANMHEDSKKDLLDVAWDAKISKLCDYCAFQKVCPAKTVDAPKPGSSSSDAILAGAGLLRK